MDAPKLYRPELTEHQRKVSITGNILASTAMSFAVDAKKIKESGIVTETEVTLMETRLAALTNRLNQLKGMRT
jgi:hypothetical protein